MYAVVEFLKNREVECALIPVLWLTENGSRCYWPQTKTEEKFKSLVRTNAAYEESWTLHDVNRVIHTGDDYEKVDEYMSNIIENGTSEDGTTHQPITQKTLISDVSDTKSGELQDDEPPKKKRKKNKRDERHKKNKRQKQVSTSSNSATEELSPMSSFNDENKPQNIPTYERSVTGLEPNSDGRDKFSYTQDQHRTANFRSGATTSPTNVTTKQHGINVTARQNQRNGNELLRTPRSNQQRTPGEQGKSSQERILKYLEQISSVVDQNQITLVQLLRMNNAQVHPSIVPHGFPDLPITSLDVFDQFNETLKNEEHRVYLISRLASVGGLSQRQAVMNMLKFTMSNSLAMEYNWAGREKRCFKKTELMQVINEAAKTAFHGKPESSDLNISSAMKDWLKLATTRHTYSITSKKAVQK